MKKHTKMKRMRLISSCLLLTLLIWATVFSHVAAADPYLEVIPTQHDFGEVEIGSSSHTIIILSNFNGHSLIIYDIAFRDGSSSDFSIVSDLVFPIIVNPMDSMDVEISFSPTSEGASLAVLQIESNDPGKPIVEVELVGVGVSYEPSPSEKIDEILAFFDEAVEDGTLAGRGSSWIADWRLNRLRNILERAKFLIENEMFGLACWQLKRAYGRTDGQPFPRDFVKGESASELATMIMDLRIRICT